MTTVAEYALLIGILSMLIGATLLLGPWALIVGGIVMILLVVVP